MCPSCGKPFSTDDDEVVHNTGDCKCPLSRELCWRPWLGVCQPTDEHCEVSE